MIFKKKNLSKSSKEWLKRKENDIFSKKKKEENLPCRSYFKIEEIHNKYKIFKKNQKVLDLGCCPGGWSSFIKKYTEDISGCDLTDNMKISIKNFILGDFVKQKHLFFENYDCILSDMAINSTGNKWIDNYNNFLLFKEVWFFAINHLKKSGILIIKIFESNDINLFIKEIKNEFLSINIFKPKCSYKESRECYFIAINFLKKNK